MGSTAEISFRCYLGDDISDDAFRAGSGSGSGVVVGEPDDRG